MFNYPPQIPDAVCEIYKSVNGIDLNIWRFEPTAVDALPKPAILFFFGGGFHMGSPEQFVSQARYLSDRGMIAMVADYRVASRNGVKGVQCLEDAKSALRWVRANAERLGIDPQRIAAGGGSAGGYLAAATATVPGYAGPANDEFDHPPAALVLFNPGVVMAPVSGLEMDDERIAALADRMGADPESVSPYHHVTAGAPPTIIFHGRADTTIPFATAELFTQKMHELGNRCELFGYNGQAHGFFNIGRGNGSAYTDTVRRMDGFLTSLGWLDELR